ncbi:MAG: ABC transporter substrate-binding protein [Spirochaetaceae bacterium]|nr:ABC transporter substrate-binding protein [Spirochaetaceae bacterium]
MVTRRLWSLATLATGLMLLAATHGAAQYQESPMLAEMVANGELPPVEERVSNNPFVREVHSEIGTYGGTFLGVDQGKPSIGWLNLAGYNTEGGGIAFDIPFDVHQWVEDGMHLGADTLNPFYFESYTINDDFTVFEGTIRENARWSDGEPFTAEDIAWVYNMVHIHPEVNQIPRWFAQIGDDVVQVEAISDRTVRFTSPVPHPLMHMWILAESTHAKHWLEDYHPEVNSDRSYEDLHRRMNREEHPQQPWLGPWVLESYDPATKLVAVRNPYYPVVDTEGNQLPYIDRIERRSVANKEAAILAMVQGEVTAQQGLIALSDLQVLREGQSRGDYTIDMWTGGARQGWVNLIVEPTDEKLAKYIREIDFRRALSLALNRDEMNDTLFFGLGETAGTVVSPNSVFYDPRMDTYAEYDPDRARSLLEGLGLTDSNGDGLLEYPEGGNVTMVLDVHSGVPDTIPPSELIVGYWKEIGIDATMDVLAGSGWAARCGGDGEAIMWVGPSFEPYLPNTFLGRQFSPLSHMCGHGLVDPPQEYKDIWELEQELTSELDAERYVELVKDFYVMMGEDVLFQIAHIAEVPIPVLRSNKIGNMPETGVKLKGIMSAHLDQFYFK